MTPENMTRSDRPTGNLTSRMLGHPPPPYSDLHNYASSCPRDIGLMPGHVSEHCLQTDLELPVYPGSPSSFYMYEQERKDLNDMHTSVGAVDCSSVGSPCTSSVTESVPGIDLMDLDLETSLDWNNLLIAAFPKMETEEQGSTTWEELMSQDVKWENALQCSSGMDSQPTLAELNNDSIKEELDLFNLRATVMVKEEPISAAAAAAAAAVCSSAQLPMSSAALSTATKASFINLVSERYPKCHTATSPSTVTPASSMVSAVAGQPIRCTMTGMLQMMTDVTSTGQERVAVPAASPGDLMMPKSEPVWDVEYTACTRDAGKRSGSPASNTSSSSINKKWEEIKQFIHEEGAQVDANDNNIGPPAIDTGQRMNNRIRTCSNNSDMTFSIDGDDSQAEGFDSDYDSDYDCQTDYGTEGLGIEDEDVYLPTYLEVLSEKGSFMSPPSKQTATKEKNKRYFWQYNTQSKGPKGERLCKKVGNIDPHILSNFEDPVFDPDIGQAGPAKYKHNGKARKGDGNDVTPNPYKLYQIGGELKQLDRIINDIAPPGELPCNIRPKSRKEKNKLASRACRLKKKAQHEANKVKLYGLDTEHHQLMTVLDGIRSELVKFVRIKPGEPKPSETDSFRKLLKLQTSEMVSGNTTDFVNSVLQKVAAGDRTGGLN